jgi:hypothetical protein
MWQLLAQLNVMVSQISGPQNYPVALLTGVHCIVLLHIVNRY